MATNAKLSNVAAAACAGDGTNKGLLPLLAGGIVELYDGTQPTDPDTGVGGGNHAVCATTKITLGTPAATESNGVLTLATLAQQGIVSYVTAPPTWFRIFESNGTTALWDGTVGTSGADMNFAGGLTFVVGGTINLSGTLTIPAH